MATPIIYFDLTELMVRPMRTGIQRVQRELIRHWPGPAMLLPVRYVPAIRGMQLLPDTVLDVLTEDAAGGPDSERRESARLAPLLARGRALNTASGRVSLLNVELFKEPDRGVFMRRLCAGGSDVAMLVHDFLTTLRPQYFPPGVGSIHMPYVRTLRAATRLAFVSEATRQDWLGRITRGGGGDGPVITLGGDTPASVRQQFRPDRRGFLSLGTLEARKNSLALLEAFELLWQSGQGADLYVVGICDEPNSPEGRALARLADAPWLHHLPRATDGELHELLGQVRAMIFASEEEGFGLPPFEALHAGIPVVVHQAVPSIATLPPAGQIRLAHCDPASLAAAVRMLQDDALAAELWRDAATLDVPTWRAFAHQIASWLQTS
jgi:glycosyltransferase involved in cell wall biosynthesis